MSAHATLRTLHPRLSNAELRVANLDTSSTDTSSDGTMCASVMSSAERAKDAACLEGVAKPGSHRARVCGSCYERGVGF